jgi:cell division protein FtsL
MSRRCSPIAKPSRLVPALLAVGIVAGGFATLMIRLENTQEGYRLSSLRAELRDLDTENQRLRLEAAELSSNQRLRALAAKYHLAPPPPGHSVLMP